jgi:transposase
MPSSKTVDPSIVIGVSRLLSEGKNYSEIGRMFNHQPSWAKRLLEFYDGETGLRLHKPAKTGRRRKTSPVQDFVIESYAVSCRKAKIKDITSTVKDELGMEVSHSTINR